MRAVPAVIPVPMVRNRHRNYLNASNRLWSGWSQSISGGGLAPVVSGENITFEVAGAVGWSWIALDISALVAVGLNRGYAFSFEVMNSAGGYTDQIYGMFGGPTLVAGSEAIAKPGALGRYGVLAQYSAAGAATLRIGIGTNGVNQAAGSILTIRRPCLEMALDMCGGPYYEGVSPQAEVFRTYDQRASLSGTTTGLVTVDKSQAASVPSGVFGLIVGDSFGTSQFAASGWPDMFLRRFPQFGFFNAATAGRTLQTMAANIASILAYPETDATGVGVPSFAVIQGGINDAVSGASFDNLRGKRMLGDFATIATAIQAAGIKKIIALGVSPASGSASYVAASGHQIHIDSYNAMLESYCRKNGFVFVDLYRLLKSEVNGVALDPAFDVGDALHPNAYGAARIARAVYRAYCELM